MNALAPIRENPRPVRQVVEDVVPMLDTGRFEHMQRIATVMANTSLLPESLQTYKDDNGKVQFLPLERVMANCFLVVNQSVRWGMDPFAVAQCVSIVKGKLCYEGKLVAAVLDAKLGIALDYTYDEKPGDQLGITVSGLVDGKVKTVSGTVAAWKTTGAGSPWSPATFKRQLAYRGAREWARLHKPALMLGAYTDDEIEDMQEVARSNRARDISAPPPPPMELIAPEPSPESAPAAPLQEADAAGASPTIPLADAPAAAEGATDPEAEIANLDEVLANCTDEACIHEGYAYLDIEATLAPFSGMVEKARAVRDEHLRRVARQSEPAPAAPAAEDASDDVPPPPADDAPEAPAAEEDMSTPEAYEALVKAKLAAAGDFKAYEEVRVWWTATRPVRHGLGISAHEDIARLQGYFVDRKAAIEAKG